MSTAHVQVAGLHNGLAKLLAAAGGITREMSASQLHIKGVIGYLLPASTTMVGAALTAPGGDATTAIGASFGLVAGLLAAHLLIGLWAADEKLAVSCVAEFPISTNTHSTHLNGETP